MRQLPPKVLSLPELSEDVLGPRSRVAQTLVLIFAVIPIAFFDNRALGFQLTGWTWLLVLIAITPLVLTAPVHGRAVGYILPYLLFLFYALITMTWAEDLFSGAATFVQLLLPALTYLVAWRAPHNFAHYRKLRVACLCGLGVALILALLSHTGAISSLPLSPSVRGMSISLAVLFVAATINSKSARYTILVWALATAVSISLGSRMSSAVLMLLLLCSPSLGMRWPGRIAVALGCLLLVLLLSQTEAFQERFFFHSGGSLMDIVTVSNDVNTAGRAELWPELRRECSAVPLTGFGVGASYGLSSELSGGAMSQPHNDYLRTYCDEGYIGSILFWGFFLLVGLRSWRGFLTGRDPRLHGAAGQLVLAVLVLAATDNPVVYTAHFMVPIAVILGLSDRGLSRG